MASSVVIQAINDIGDSVESFRKSHEQRVAELGERIEVLEAGKDRPKGTIGTTPRPEGFKSYPSAKGTVYELDSKTRMADVLPPEKQPEVSLGRFLAAATLGEKSSDTDALAYAREQKQLTTGTSGIVIPEDEIFY